MEDRLRILVDKLSPSDLRLLQDDICGGQELKAIISTRLESMEKTSVCAVCGEELNKEAGHYSLIFGPKDLKKKANFCAMDCLEYFISRMKESQHRLDAVKKS